MLSEINLKQPTNIFHSKKQGTALSNFEQHPTFQDLGKVCHKNTLQQTDRNDEGTLMYHVLRREQ